MTKGGETHRAPTGRRANRDAAFEVAFGQRIRAARVAAGMSQGALGEAAGISFQQIQKYEHGKDRVSVGTLQVLAAALDVAPGSFFSDEGSMPPSRPDILPRPVPPKKMREAQRVAERIVCLSDPSIVRRLVALVDAIIDAKRADLGSLPAGDDPHEEN